MERRFAPALVAMVLALAAALTPAEQAPEPEPAAPAWANKLFFSMQIADERGAVLAEPKLLGLSGIPLEMTLATPGLEVPQLNLRLESVLGDDGLYSIAYELEVPGLAARGSGPVRMRAGEEKSARVEYPGGHLDMQLATFAVPSDEFRLFLQHGLDGRPART